MTETPATPGAPPLQLWGGAECTIVRVGDDYRDQIDETGHGARGGDVDRIVSLGIRKFRQPILWERVAPDSLDSFDFAWSDARVAALGERGIGIVAGLLHHGSGPRYTSLVDQDFPEKLGRYAAAVAARYPWLDEWTPVNEPLTTARFSGLYGHWYPHRRDYRTFLRALVNQCLGTLHAMRAIRAVNPAARLVQTEDLGKTFSTAPLAHQARHENQRRWLSLDLLCGRVTRRHPWWPILRDHGIAEAELDLLAGGEAAPDLVGINHYLTSERFLDHRLHLYPGQQPGENGRDTYVDAEAVRVRRLEGETGIAPRLEEAWRRYRLPLAITEVHHGCHRDEQLRWFAEVWDTAGRLRAGGMDLRAVTLWSLFGNVDWRYLLTEKRGFYDAGAWDVRPEEPRPTVIAAAAHAFAAEGAFDHPVLDSPGWWRRPARLYPWQGRCKPAGGDGRRLLVTGATGTLGQAFARVCEGRALHFRLTRRAELDIADPGSISAALAEHRPWAVINTAGFVRVADAEREVDACLRANADGAANLASACTAAGIPLVTFSSDLVFDGQAGRPYVEDDPVAPACVYGRSKAEAEARVLAAGGRPLVVRTSAFFGPWDRYNFGWAVLDALARGDRFRASRSVVVSPTWVPDLCHVTLDLLIDGVTGIRHVANRGALSWHDFAVRIAEAAGYDPALVDGFDEPAASNVLASRHGTIMRPVEHAIADFVAEVVPLVEAPLPIAAE